MRITLVVPGSSLPFTTDRFQGSLLKPQISPLALAAVATPHHDVTLVDSQLHQLPPARIADKVIETAPDLVGISLNFSTLTRSAGIIARETRKALGPEVPILWGGNVATFNCEQILRHEVADVVFLHEADRSFPDYLARVETGSDGHDTSGIAFLDGDRLVRQPFGGYVQDLDSLPIPSYQLFEQPERYQRALITTRGCPYHCIYCSTKAMWGKWRARSAEHVLEELARHVEEADPDRVAFIDDNFPVKRDRAYRICEGIQRSGWEFEWGFSARLEMVDRKLLERCAEANCRALFFGIESGSPRVLKAMRRRYSIDDVLRTVDLCVDLGILPTCSFMVGIPFETEEDVQMTFDLIERLNTPMIQLHVFTPLVGTPVYEEPEKFGIEHFAHNLEFDCMDASVFHRTAHLSQERIHDLFLEGKGICAERAGERPAYYSALKARAAQMTSVQ